MIKNILTAAIVVALSACSSSDSGDDTTNTPIDNSGTAGEPGDGSNIPPAGPADGGAGLVDGTKAGSYIGDFGGAQGVYIINNEFQLSGLAIDADGSAQSLFGDMGANDTFSGGLRQYQHQESLGNAAADSFGANPPPSGDLEIDVNILNGQSIMSTADSIVPVSLVVTAGTVTPATAASLAGTWEGSHSFCTDNGGVLTDCQLLVTELTFNGTQVTGSTLVTDEAGAVVPNTQVFITGGITEFGDAAAIEFNWGNSTGYNGLVFFTPSGDGRIAYIGENVENAPNFVISAVLTKQP